MRYFFRFAITTLQFESEFIITFMGRLGWKSGDNHKRTDMTKKWAELLSMRNNRAWPNEWAKHARQAANTFRHTHKIQTNFVCLHTLAPYTSTDLHYSTHGTQHPPLLYYITLRVDKITIRSEAKIVSNELQSTSRLLFQFLIHSAFDV